MIGADNVKPIIDVRSEGGVQHAGVSFNEKRLSPQVDHVTSVVITFEKEVVGSPVAPSSSTTWPTEPSNTLYFNAANLTPFRFRCRI